MKPGGIAIFVAIMLLSSLAYGIQNATQDLQVGEPFEPTYRNFVNGAFATTRSNASGPSAPSNPNVGDSWYDTGAGNLKIWNGSSWVIQTGGGGSGCIPSGSTGTLQTSNGSGACSAFSGNGPLTSHQFATTIGGAGNLSGRQPTDTDLTFSDNTSGNVSTAAHGFVPKAPNDTTLFLRGDATWATAGAGGGATTLDAHAGSPFFSQTANVTTNVYTLWSYSVPAGTLATAGELNIDATLTYTNTTSADAPSIGIGWGTSTLLAQIPTSIATGSATAIKLHCAVRALGVATLQSGTCDLWIDNGTGLFESANVSLNQNAANAVIVTLQYQDSASINSTIKLYQVRISSGSGTGTGGGGGGGGSGTVNSGTTGQLAYYATSGTTVSGNPSSTITNGDLTLGQSGSVIGDILLSGSTSGLVTIIPQAAAGTYNFNLPTSAGTAGQPLLSGGGGASPQTYGILGVAAGGRQCGAPSTFSGLPGSPTNGEICNVTDAIACYAGSAVTAGGGSTKCEVTYNGTNWMPSGGSVLHAIVPAAHCDGITDDSSIINTAISSASTGSIIVLPSGKNCKISSGITLTTAVGFDGNGSTLTSTMTTSGSTAITISSVSNGSNYAGNRVPYRRINLIGPGSSSTNWGVYNSGTTGLLLKASNISIEGANITGYNNGILYGNFAYMVSVFDPQIYANYWGVLFPFVPLTDAGENLNWTGGSVFNNTIGLEDDGGSASEFHFEGTSFDYNTTQIVPNGGDTFDHIHLEGITAAPFQMSGGYNNYTHLWVSNSNIIFGSSTPSSSIPLISITGTSGEYASFDHIFLSGFQQSNASANWIAGAGAGQVSVCHATDTFLSATARDNLGPFGYCGALPGQVTLTFGLGLFSDPALNAQTVCTGRDVTNPSQTIAFDGYQNGQVTVHGANSDVVQIKCL